MAINISKICDPRSWAKWLASGAIVQSKLSKQRVAEIAGLLRNAFATQDGTIDPWGTIRILKNGIPDATSCQYERFHILQPGLPIWSAKLIRFGKGGYHAVIKGCTIVVMKEDSVITAISPADCDTVEIEEYLVETSGYLCYECKNLADDLVFRKKYEDSLRQVDEGKRPDFLDNSAFVRVSKGLAGEHVVKLTFNEFSNEIEESALVFTRDGQQIPCTCDHPLSYAKWDSASPYASAYCSEA